MAQVNAAYENNADYDLENSVVKAKAFILAGRILIRRMLQESAHPGGSRVGDDYHKIEAAVKEASEWWRANDTDSTSTKPNSMTRRMSFRDFRS